MQQGMESKEILLEKVSEENKTTLWDVLMYPRPTYDITNSFYYVY